MNVLPGETWDCTFNNTTFRVPVPPGTPGTPGAPPAQVSPEQVQVSPEQVQVSPEQVQVEAQAVLAFTGSDSTAPLALLGAVLVALGAFTVVLSRRRRRGTATD